MILYRENIGKIAELIDSHTKTFVLTDENSNRLCLGVLRVAGLDVEGFVKIVIPAGEQHKNLKTVEYIWSQLVENKADRKLLLINLGGGMLTDIGGFAASCYQRGIDFINVPTTLLAMIDAAVGGKTGIDFQGLKNQIGLFSQPLAVLILEDFLATLPKRELQSGLAEIIKYGFIVDKSFLEASLTENAANPIDSAFVRKAIEAKDVITRSDANEQGLRKILNFGHTVGHALETYLIGRGGDIRHGEAVALGMIPALYLSEKYCHLDHKWTLYYKSLYAKNFNRFDLSGIAAEDLLEIMRHDKKNEGGDIRFVLIEELGKPVYDVVVDLKYILDSVNYLIEYQKNENC